MTISCSYVQISRRGDDLDHTDDFAENWRIQGEGNQPLNETTIEDFIQAHGREQAIGYLRAIRDVINEIEYATFDTRPNIGLGSRPLTRVKNNINKWLLHKTNFLKIVEEKHGINPVNKPR